MLYLYIKVLLYVQYQSFDVKYLYLQKDTVSVHHPQYQKDDKIINKAQPYGIIAAEILFRSIADRSRYGTEVNDLT